ncbi:MAG TPA: asparagine synthase C-terminal domain-containing protein, partial [Burkholderiales bacterium]
RDMLGVLEEWGDLYDEPFGDQSGVPTYLVSKMARRHVKVALSADGGDELFSGYARYALTLARQRRLVRVPRAARVALSHALEILAPAQHVVERLPVSGVRHATRRTVVDRVEKLRHVLPDADPGTIYDLSMSFWLPGETSRLLGETVHPRPALNGYPRKFPDHMSCCDIRHYLPDDILTKVDRTTMAVGLEGREPLLDHRLVEFALRLPYELRQGSLGTKHLLRRVLYRYVPKSVLERPKQGFSMPMSRWLRGDLAPLIDNYLDPQRVRAAGVLDPAVTERAVRNFREGGPARDRIDVQKVWLLVAFEMWREKWA